MTSLALTPTGALAGVGRRIVRIPAFLAIALVRGYQIFVSPLTPPSCKYYPCCSSYSVTALRRFGLVRGVALTAWRLARCNPWSSGGVDDVPETWRWRRPADPTTFVPLGTHHEGAPGRPDTDRSTTV